MYISHLPIVTQNTLKYFRFYLISDVF